MRPLSPEAVTGYPKWTGQLSRAPRVWSIVMQEIRRAVNDQWARSALILAFGFAVITLGQMYAIVQTRPSFHSKAQFLSFLGLLRWAALGVAAVMAGGALLDDDKKGALELYLSRAVTRWSYLTGKVLAVLALTFATIFGPALVYYLGAFVLFKTQPEGWAWVILGAAGFAAIWSIVVAGLGLGISCLVRSSRAASIILFAGIAGMDIVLGKLLSGITKSDTVKVLSPMSDMDQQGTWLFQIDPPLGFPWWQGAVALLVLAILGWSLVWLRHPRIRGVS
ncbi:MAG TPA: ABC transporter permease subunit [Candidatus Thermoplasmatota archaeon]|nr:ABC transporter permease subunit [Candidatus Thermoplasmatota archaeon]